MEGAWRFDYTDYVLDPDPAPRASLTVRSRANENRPMMRTATRYTRTAITLHWLAGALILCGFALGLWLKDLPISPQTLRLYGYHKWIGITVFLLALMRLAWRRAHPAPPPVVMPEWQRRAAAATHALLYAFMLVIPLSGWVYSSASGVQVVYLGLVPLPDLVPKDKALAGALKIVHITLDYTLLALVAVHAGAALKHHWVERDDVLRRMLPFLPRRQGSAPP